MDENVVKLDFLYKGLKLSRKDRDSKFSSNFFTYLILQDNKDGESIFVNCFYTFFRIEKDNSLNKSRSMVCWHYHCISAQKGNIDKYCSFHLRSSFKSLAIKNIF